MATFNTNSSKGYFLRLVVNETSQSIANNTTTLSWSLTAYSGANNSMNRNNQVIKASINGTSVYSSTRNITLGFSSSQSLGSGTITVGHGTDGSKSVAIAFSWQTDNYSLAYTPDALLTASTSMTLTKIPRASSASLSTSSPSYGGAFTVNISRHSTSFTHEVTISLPGKSTVITGVGTGHTFTIPSDWMTGIPNATTGAGTVKVQTKNGSTNVGSAVSMSFTASVPSNIVPSVSFGGPTYSNYPSGFESRPIIGHTTISCTSSASGTYGSSISSYSWSTNGASATSQNFSFKANTTGHSITITVRDSRGRTASATKSVNCVKLDSLVSALSVSSGSINYGSTNTVHMNRHSSSFTHTVALSLPHRSASWTGQTTSTAMSVPAEWMNGVGTSTSASAVVTVTTYWGGTTVGSNSISFTAVVPSNIVPTLTFNQPSVTSGLSGYSGSIIGVSTIQCSASYAGTYSSEIRSVAWSTNGHSGNSSSFNFTPNTGTHSIRCTVTDSRGRTATIDRSVSSVAYSSPNLSAISCQRCTGDGTVSSDGQYIRFVPTFSFTNIGNLNNPTLTYSINTSPTTSGTDASATSGKVYSPLGNNTALKTKSYVLSATITDKVGRVSSRSFTIPVSEVLLNFPSTANALGIGMYNQGPNRLDIGWYTYISNAYSSGMVRGDFSGSRNISTSAGWLTLYEIEYSDSNGSDLVYGGSAILQVSRSYASPNNESATFLITGAYQNTKIVQLAGAFNSRLFTEVRVCVREGSGSSWFYKIEAYITSNPSYANTWYSSLHNVSFPNCKSIKVSNFKDSSNGGTVRATSGATFDGVVYNNNNRPSATAIGALPIYKQTANLNTTTGTALHWHRPASPTGWMEGHNGQAVLSMNTHDGNFYTQLGFSTNTNKMFIRSADNKDFTPWYQVYTTQYKPSAADVGLGSVSNWGSSSSISANSTAQYATTNMVAQVRSEKANQTGTLNYKGGTTNLDTVQGTGVFSYADTTTGRPTSYGTVLQFANVSQPVPGTNQHWITQIACGTSGEFFHRYRTNTGGWSAWQRQFTTGGGTITGQTVFNNQVYALGGSNFIARQIANDSTAQLRLENTAGTVVSGVYIPNNGYNLHVRSHGGSWVLLRANSGVKVRNTADSAYTPCLASAFTVNSERKWKTNIEEVKESALSKINNTSIFSYDKLEGDKTKRHEIGLIIEDGIPEELMHEVERTDERTPEEKEEGVIFEPGTDKFVDLYSMTSLGWKATQELSDQDDAMEADITYQEMIMEHQEEVALQQQADLDYQEMIIESQNIAIKEQEEIITQQQADIDFMLMIMEG